jgi:hypothetical protein
MPTPGDDLNVQCSTVIEVVMAGVHQEKVQKLLDFFTFSSEKVKKQKKLHNYIPNKHLPCVYFLQLL